MPSDPDPTPGVPGGGHYFEARPQAASARHTVPMVLPDLSVSLMTDRAVFSGDRVDPGTKYLLLDAPPPGPGVLHALDLGCGYGAIATTLAHRAPDATVWAVDVNERAVALCAENAGRLGRANVRTSTVTDDRPFGDVPDEVRFDLIWSNPPIRIGKPALHHLLTRWLARLTPNGRAVLVVQKHLGSDSLQRWLGEQGYTADRLGSRAAYRLIEVIR